MEPPWAPNRVQRPSSSSLDAVGGSAAPSDPSRVGSSAPSVGPSGPASTGPPRRPRRRLSAPRSGRSSSRSTVTGPKPAASRSGPNASASPTSRIADRSGQIRSRRGLLDVLDRHGLDRRPIASQLVVRQLMDDESGRARRRSGPGVSKRSGNTPTRKSRAARELGSSTGASRIRSSSVEEVRRPRARSPRCSRPPGPRTARRRAAGRSPRRRRTCSPSPRGASCSVGN